MARRKVDKILDGDTFKTKRPIKGTRYIRPSGYDTPEKGKRGYKKATNQLKKLISGKTVNIDVEAIKRNRVIGKVKVNGKSVNRSMKRRGY